MEDPRTVLPDDSRRAFTPRIPPDPPIWPDPAAKLSPAASRASTDVPDPVSHPAQVNSFRRLLDPCSTPSNDPKLSPASHVMQQQGGGQGGQGGPPGAHGGPPAGMPMIYGQPYGQFPQGAPHPGDPNAQQQWQQQARAAQLQQAQLQAYHMQSHQVNQHHQQQLRMFWQQQMQEIESGSDFKNHQLPLARIKKIMKSDEDVRMISSEAPVLFAKACEMFILELTLRSWIHSEENKRRTLQRNDIAAAITKTDIFDFLVDIVPRDDFKEDGMNVPRAPPAAVALGAPGGDGQGAGGAGAVPAVPYNPGMYYMQPPPGTMAGGQWPPQMSQDPNQYQMPPKQ